MNNIVREIFYGRALTLTKNNGYILNKWGNGDSFEIPLRVGNYLVNLDILELDSANLETGEQHFIYNDSDNQPWLEYLDKTNNRFLMETLTPILRDIRLNKILK